ncbi:hypothetical protein [Sulfobacillus sp. hq2]|uniref:hypothetical protein n=1 Tax=Sulfobacillus sp. hq2 TaxID=2039167 RepID=UPI0011AF35EC|nr:hypothetical protein [Sulfobacillus sp. hq2]
MSVVALRGRLTPSSHTRRVESPDGPTGTPRADGRDGEPVARYVRMQLGSTTTACSAASAGTGGDTVWSPSTVPVAAPSSS